jgi:HD superfamily phosphohydrolase
MPKVRHEVRDVLYGFVEFDDLEKQLIDSRPFQRLRSIHQLATCYQVYPGASHKRFEHLPGVMEMATQILDRVPL